MSSLRVPFLRVSLRAAALTLATLMLATCAERRDAVETVPAPTDAATTTSVAPVAALTTTTVAAVPSAVFADAAALAAELSVVEASIRVPDVPPIALADLGRRQQLAYRGVSQRPEWHAELLASVQPVALGPLTFHLAARQALVDHAAGRPATPPSATLPAWTIVEPLPVAELRAYYDEAEAVTGVPWQYLAAIHFQETRMGRVVGQSSSGAVGPMQFLPSTWEQCCEGDPTVTRDAVLGAARYLVLSGAPSDMQAALSAYNPNSGYVGAVTAYAQNMIADERAYFGYHGWEVFYGSSEGTVRLPVGYSQAAPIDAAAYLRDHPSDLVVVA